MMNMYAATRTWDGGGADNNWSTAANWSGDIAPSAGDDLVFSGSTRTTPNNDYTAGTSFNTITFSNGASSFTVGGNSILLTGGASAITASNASNTMTITLSITFSSSAPTITSTSGGILTFSTGTIANGGFAITITGTGTTNFNGVVSGSGSITKSGTGSLTVAAANTFTGGVTLNAGTLNISNASGFGTTAGTVTIAGGTLSNTKGSAIVLSNYPYIFQNSFTLDGTAGNFDLGAGAITLQANITITTTSSGTDYFDFGGDVSGAFNIIHNSSGYLSFSSSSSTFTGTYSDRSSYGTYVSKLANVSASSSLGAPSTVANGTIALGNGSTSGALIFTGSSAMSTNRVINMAGTTGGIEFWNIMTGSNAITFTSDFTATGDGNKTVYLYGTNSSAQNVIGGIIPNAATGTTSLTVDNSGFWILTAANTYTGTTTITDGTLQIGNGSTTGSVASTSIVNNAALRVSRSDAMTYSGVISGTGTLTKLSAGTLTLTGTNTMSGTTTISAGTLSIGSGSTGGSLANSNITNNSALIFNRSNAITYSGVVSGTGTLSQNGSGTTTLTGTNTYTGSTTISAGTLSVGAGSTTGSIASASIVNNAALIFNRSNSITYSGVISGTGTLTKSGAGTLTLSGANTYSGSTTISAGIIAFGATNAISSSSIILNSGTLSTGTTTGYSSTTTGTLTLNDHSTIALGSGSHTISFAASNGSTWTSGKRLYITGWQGGYNGTTGTSGQIFTGSSAELSAGKLSQIYFVNPGNGNNYTATQLASGEIVPTSVLPVVYAYFNITQADYKNIIQWSTTQEINNKSFEIERSLDGINFEKIGMVKGNNNSNNQNTYYFEDQSVNAGASYYYRLKQIDHNNRFEYSEIKFIKANHSNQTLTLFPNPVDENENIFITFNNHDYGTVLFEIFTIQGALIHTFEIHTIKPLSTYEIGLKYHFLSEGEYILKTKTDQTIYTNTFLIK